MGETGIFNRCCNRQQTKTENIPYNSDFTCSVIAASINPIENEAEAAVIHRSCSNWTQAN
jgi:hypothetical protein